MLSAKLLAIVGGVIVCLFALLMSPIIFDTIGTILQRPDITNFPGVKELIKLFPLLYVVSCLFTAGFLTWKGVGEFRGGRRRR